MTHILNGTLRANKIQESLQARVAAASISPKLVIISIGDNEASQVYIEKKRQFGEQIGVTVDIVTFPSDVEDTAVLEVIATHNTETATTGIILQLPIPAHLDKEVLVNSIAPEKDVDGLTARNMWRLMDNQQGIVPATARGIELLLEDASVQLEGAHVVIVGDSFLVGKSTAVYFLNKDATVTVCHDKTDDIAKYTKQADILVTAVGKEHVISVEHVDENQVLVDVGIIRNAENKIVGDVDFENVKNLVRAITPVPGGVGPMTVACLFENIVNIAEGK